MITTVGRRRTAAVLLALAAFLAPSAAPAGAATPPAATPPTAATVRALPEPSPADQARAELAGLTVAEPHAMTGYTRAKFPHWVRQDGECDTREVVLARDGEGVTRDELCRAGTGVWLSPYDGKVLTTAAQVDIDHVVPLANAWRSGADEWTTAARRAFANDLEHSQLIAVSAAANRSKADKSPDQWSPPDRTYWCTYSRAWIDVKHLYRLNVTGPEAARLTEMLDTCA
ncbi:HNH endonuclease family protein [Kitasatospora sp. NPDC096147]|uniref:HNH endonuclease family protein n=1 Tax=Kitasatospora sp. NPDC096147 TaxID=3364093 RepID=UPI00380BEADD